MNARQIKQEIDRLSRQQEQALQRATYVSLTPEEARELESRRKQITALRDQLVSLMTSE